MRKTRRSTTRRRQTKRGGKFQMKVKNTSCNNTGKNRTNALPDADDKTCGPAGFCWKAEREGKKSEPWCYKPFPDKFNIIIKK